MTSPQAALVIGLLRLINWKRIFQSAETLQRAAARATPATKNVWYTPRRVRLNGDPARINTVVTLTPAVRGPAHILYLYGSGWVFPASRQHWSFLARLAARSSSIVHVPLYPLAPQHTYRDVMAFLLPVYRQLVATGSEPVVVMGDSAGGNIALALMKAALVEGLPMPAGLSLVSPVVDAAFGNPEARRIERDDPMLALGGAKAAARWYGGDISVEDERISPLRGALSHLPPTQLFIGTRELLWPDVRLFREKALRSGVELEYHEGDGMMHAWPIVPFLPEGRIAIEQMAAFIVRRADAFAATRWKFSNALVQAQSLRSVSRQLGA